MSARKLNLIFLMTFVLNVLSLDLQRLADDCLKDRVLHETENLKCETLNGVKVQRIQDENQTFYCFKYEKKTGVKIEFDVLSFDLHEDYDLKYVKSTKSFAMNFNSNLINFIFRLELMSFLTQSTIPNSSFMTFERGLHIKENSRLAVKTPNLTLQM